MAEYAECPACGSPDRSDRLRERDRGGLLTGYACRHDWHDAETSGVTDG